jgi:EAL and modified HD-GYP domain-containing signal transduction protein
MSENIYIARQPIVDNDKNIVAFELLFRSIQKDGSILPIFEDNLLATTRVLVNTMNHIGLNNLVQDKQAFVNIDEEMLLDNMITTIPKERFVLEILETVQITPTLVARIQELKDAGYTLALDDAHCDASFIDNFSPIFPFIDILKLDITLIDIEVFKQNLEKFKSFDMRLLAEKVESEEEFLAYQALGCELYQGYFFAKPKIITHQAMDPHYKNIFNLIKLLDKDMELDDLSLEFEKQADITLQLLRFMNSGQTHLKTDIKSMKHAISLLGKIPLKQWLLLIAYSKSEQSSSARIRSPLLELASSRATLMYNLMHALHKDMKKSHEAAFVGLLSLMHAIVHIPIEEILDELHVAQQIREAITDFKGEFGALLELIVAVEEFDLENANAIAQNLKISQESFRDALLESIKDKTQED